MGYGEGEKKMAIAGGRSENEKGCGRGISNIEHALLVGRYVVRHRQYDIYYAMRFHIVRML